MRDSHTHTFTYRLKKKQTNKTKIHTNVLRVGGYDNLKIKRGGYRLPLVSYLHPPPQGRRPASLDCCAVFKPRASKSEELVNTFICQTMGQRGHYTLLGLTVFWVDLTRWSRRGVRLWGRNGGLSSQICLMNDEYIIWRSFRDVNWLRANIRIATSGGGV